MNYRVEGRDNATSSKIMWLKITGEQLNELKANASDLKFDGKVMSIGSKSFEVTKFTTKLPDTEVYEVLDSKHCYKFVGSLSDKIAIKSIPLTPIQAQNLQAQAAQDHAKALESAKLQEQARVQAQEQAKAQELARAQEQARLEQMRQVQEQARIQAEHARGQEQAKQEQIKVTQSSTAPRGTATPTSTQRPPLSQNKVSTVKPPVSKPSKIPPSERNLELKREARAQESPEIKKRPLVIPEETAFLINSVEDFENYRNKFEQEYQRYLELRSKMEENRDKFLKYEQSLHEKKGSSEESRLIEEINNEYTKRVKDKNEYEKIKKELESIKSSLNHYASLANKRRK